MNLKRFFISLCALLCLWQFSVVWWHFPDFTLPGPAQILKTLITERWLLLKEMLPTLAAILFGLIGGISLGIISSLILAIFPRLNNWFMPFLIVSQVIPTFAIAPLIVIWLGFGIASKIAITTLMIFFPITSAFYDGLMRTNPVWLDLAKTMQANQWRLFWHIKIPAAFPHLASGLRIAVISAPIGAIVGEWVGSSEGLGYIMLNANARMQIDMMFAALIMIVLIAFILYFSTDQLLRSLTRWLHTD